MIARCFVILIFVAFASGLRANVFNMPAGQTSVQLVNIGDQGNAPDTRSGEGSAGYGAVAYAYSIGAYDVTTAQYAQFLNAVAATDTYGIYNFGMNPISFDACGIVQNGVAGAYTYSVTSGYENYPVNNVSWADAARFCNWLQHGQPMGPEGPGTTETGAYTFATNQGTFLENIHRNANARYAIPTEDEWYKAAYYKGGGTNAGYWLYPTQSDIPPSDVLSAAGTNNANFAAFGSSPTAFMTPVGYFAGSPSSYGTFDQGGNVRQWNESIISELGLKKYRGLRGGSFLDSVGNLGSTFRYQDYGTVGNYDEGFRIVAVPEPSIFRLSILCSTVLVLARRCRPHDHHSMALAG